MTTSTLQLLSTMVQLGHATSQNLEFSYRSDVPVSYGEETITESNLLEIRRRHTDVVRLQTFSKHRESREGADWEWHIVGRRLTLKMRVQAKRVARNDVLRIRHVVKKTGLQQREVLIQSAQANQMRAMYCIYCTEQQRSLFRQRGPLQTGCLLVDAVNVPCITSSLSSIEWACWPWHYLFEDIPPVIRNYHFRPRVQAEIAVTDSSSRQPLDWDVPSTIDLNEDTGRDYNQTGVHETTPLDLARVTTDADENPDPRLAVEIEREGQVEKGVRGTMAIDVRSLNFEHFVQL